MSAERVVRALLDAEFGEEDIPGFVDTALGFGALMPNVTARKGVKFKHYAKVFNFGAHVGLAQVHVNAYHNLYGDGVVGSLKARFAPTTFVSGTIPEFDVDLKMTPQTANSVIRITRNFFAQLEALQRQALEPSTTIVRLRDEMDRLFEQTVEELKPYAVFVKI